MSEPVRFAGQSSSRFLWIVALQIRAKVIWILRTAARSELGTKSRSNEPADARRARALEGHQLASASRRADGIGRSAASHEFSSVRRCRSNAPWAQRITG